MIQSTYQTEKPYAFGFPILQIKTNERLAKYRSFFMPEPTTPIKRGRRRVIRVFASVEEVME